MDQQRLLHGIANKQVVLECFKRPHLSGSDRSDRYNSVMALDEAIYKAPRLCLHFGSIWCAQISMALTQGDSSHGRSKRGGAFATCNGDAPEVSLSKYAWTLGACWILLALILLGFCHPQYELDAQPTTQCKWRLAETCGFMRTQTY